MLASSLLADKTRARTFSRYIQERSRGKGLAFYRILEIARVSFYRQRRQNLSITSFQVVRSSQETPGFVLDTPATKNRDEFYGKILRSREVH